MTSRLDALGIKTRPLENRENLDEYHTSPWIGVKDIGNGHYAVTVAELVEAEMQDMRTGQITTKDTLVFTEPKIKCALPLNDTNYNVMRNAFGPVPRNWIGKRVEIYVDWSTRNPNSGEPGGVRIKPLDAAEMIAPRTAGSIMQGAPADSHQAPLKDVTPQAGNGAAGNAYATATGAPHPAADPQISEQPDQRTTTERALDDEIPF